MNKSLPVTIKNKYLILLLVLFSIQKSAATTYYVNDNVIKGDIYTTSVGNDTNDGTSPSSPKLTIKAIYESAKDGDTIIVDTGIYNDLSADGRILFPVTKVITFTIAGITNPVFSKIPIRKKEKGPAAVFYVDKDKPVDRKTYLQHKQNGETKKFQ